MSEMVFLIVPRAINGITGGEARNASILQAWQVLDEIHGTKLCVGKYNFSGWVPKELGDMDYVNKMEMNPKYCKYVEDHTKIADPKTVSDYFYNVVKGRKAKLGNGLLMRIIDSKDVQIKWEFSDAKRR